VKFMNAKFRHSVTGSDKSHTYLGRLIAKLHSWSYCLPNDSRISTDAEEQRLRKIVLLLVAGIYTILGLLWGGAYLALGFRLPGSIPLIYSVLSGAGLLYFLRSKHYGILCYSQLTLILLLPFFLQWSLGGFATSGAVIIWAILSPIGALMFAGTMRSVPWFIAYAILVILSGFTGGKDVLHTTLPPAVTAISFVMNIGGVSAIVFILLRYFVKERESAMAALDKEHRQVRHSLSLAMEVQQSLLPRANPNVEDLDITGKSVYCDETGGDYYDFLDGDPHDEGKIKVVVGDVSDHGIPSALLMATARAIIRKQSSRLGSIAEIASDVNHQLFKDVADSGRFMTMFCAEIDRRNKHMHWLNAGHEPALVYDPGTDSFDHLTGGGSLPLGVFEGAKYTERKRDIEAGQILLLLTDGIQEARNRYGEMFGREALQNVIRKNASASSTKILQAVFTALDLFQQGAKSEDDMTLMVIKVLPSKIKKSSLT
jgi:serine phosphatase RsbU (regulator of sigma subunit)